MSILEKIESSADVKALPEEELGALCSELRDFIVKNVANSGGHLASNLGAVELTVALHRVFDTAKDRIVFDVGHQCYAHKILTGRREQFARLRSFGGISGFPKPSESEHDAFIAGHASDAISAALGMAHARTLAGEDYRVAAVLGDGALTGGLAYEGLSNAAASHEAMLIILNDNNMSIARNVGGVAQGLQKLRTRPGYIGFKRRYRMIIEHFPHIDRMNHAIMKKLKLHILPGNAFTAMGLNYLGPVNGHDLKTLINVISFAKTLREPVVLHILTRKGMGCEYAERWPERYHGVGRFNAETGEIAPAPRGFGQVFGEEMLALAGEEPRLCAITAAMASGTGLEEFSERCPERFFDTGIAEEHACSMAAGLAKQGMIPVFAVYSTFLQRSYDMLIHDISLLQLHVVLAVDRAGLVGNDGETHHGVFDVSYLCSVPGMTVLCPASFAEEREMLRYAVQSCSGPVAVRYPRGGEGEYRECHLDEAVVREGSDATVCVYGTMVNEALRAAAMLEKEGISVEIVKLGCISPCDFEKTLRSWQKTKLLVAAEEVCAAGCVGSRILAKAAEDGRIGGRAKCLNLGSGIVTHGSVEELRAHCGIDAAAIAKAVRTERERI